MPELDSRALGHGARSAAAAAVDRAFSRSGGIPPHWSVWRICADIPGILFRNGPSSFDRALDTTTNSLVGLTNQILRGVRI